MKATLSLPLFALAVQGIRIVQSNDDGWAEQNIRALNDALTRDGHETLLSAPAEDKSGSCTFLPSLILLIHPD